jgi:hypothetical protein
MTLTAPAPVQEALPGYDVGGELGRGAMGVVLSARHRQLERDVAIKQLPPAFAADEEVRHRFGQEARTLAALAHPHIVPVYDYVEREGLCLLVMEALPGGTLWDRFTGEGLTMSTACTAILATCAGLEFAHSKGVLHRDVKPENLMFAADRTLKVTDFGIAQVFGGEETVTTVDGTVIGTPAYMAPEQARGDACGPPADVYAAGTVLYELLSATLPFSLEGDPVEVLERRVHEDPVPITEVAPNVPEGLAAVTMRALAREPGDRYPTAEAFGVAVAEAAAETFGPGWVGRADITLQASGEIAAAAGPATRSTGSSGSVVSSDIGATTGRETMIAGQGAPVPQDQPMRARATAIHRATGARIDELRPEDLVRIDDLITPPKPPRLALATTALAVAGLITVAILGIGSGGAQSTLAPGRVTVAGVDLASGRTVSGDLTDDVTVRVRDLPAAARDARYARLAFSVAGIDVPSRSADLVRVPGDGFRARVDAQRVRTLATGEIPTQVQLLDARKRELAAYDLRFDAERPFFLTFNGIIGLLLLAFALSYGWSALQPLRRGRRRATSYLSMGVVGGVVGLALVDLAWAIVGTPLSIPSLLVGTALGAVAFVAFARATLMNGRRRRLVLARARRGDDGTGTDEGPEPAADAD